MARLTRTGVNFSRPSRRTPASVLVEAFDAKGVTFVSVTQAFNTTNSMGRLTLNMLLSFAQFEREVTGERIRDKIAASKQKGMWMGGLPPHGYDVQDRRLVVNPGEADTVRRIFRHYAVLKSVRALKEALDREGVVSKVRRDRFGRENGGKPLARGALYRMLQNPIYRGEVRYKDKAYPGLHEAIVEEALWQEVQAALTQNRVERVTRSSAAAPSLLAGLVYDDAGERMSPTHANKKGTRYRYYVSQSLIKRVRPKASATACRVPAADLETIVEGQVCALLRSEAAVFDAVAVGPKSLQMPKSSIERAANLASKWPNLMAAERRAILQILLARIDLRRETVDITFRPTMLTDIVNSELDCKRLAASISSSTSTQLLSVPATVKRVGMEMKLLIQPEAGAARRPPGRILTRLLGQARRFNNLVMSGKGATITQLAATVGVSPSCRPIGPAVSGPGRARPPRTSSGCRGARSRPQSASGEPHDSLHSALELDTACGARSSRSGTRFPYTGLVSALELKRRKRECHTNRFCSGPRLGAGSGERTSGRESARAWNSL